MTQVVAETRFRMFVEQICVEGEFVTISANCDAGGHYYIPPVVTVNGKRIPYHRAGQHTALGHLNSFSYTVEPT